MFFQKTNKTEKRLLETVLSSQQYNMGAGATVAARIAAEDALSTTAVMEAPETLPFSAFHISYKDPITCCVQSGLFAVGEAVEIMKTDLLDYIELALDREFGIAS